MELKEIAFLAIYSIVQLFFAVDAMGMEGRGTSLLFSPFRYFGIGWLCLIAAIWWRASIQKWDLRNGLLTGILITMHYLITFAAVTEEITAYMARPDTEVGLGRVLRLRPGTIYLGVFTYFIGQIIVWGFVLRRPSRNS